MGNEIILDENQTIFSSTDKLGIITEVNEYFCEISGYSREELIGFPHNIIRHPDMPKGLFRLMWTSLLKDKKNFKGIIKNNCKNGDFYWVVTDFDLSYDKSGNLRISANRSIPINRTIIKRLSFIYKRMIEIEGSKGDMDSSIKFLNDIIYASGFNSYEDFICFLSNKKKSKLK